MQRQPLFANPLNLPWSVDPRNVGRINDCNGEGIVQTQPTTFPIDRADNRAVHAELARLTVEAVNKSARHPLMQALCIGDVLVMDPKRVDDDNIRRQKILGLKEQFGVIHIETECVDGTKVMQSVEGTLMGLSMGVLTVEVGQ